MTLEIIKIIVPVVVAAIVRALEKRSLRRKGILRDEKYFKDDDCTKMY
jgi:hypothetical protein